MAKMRRSLAICLALALALVLGTPPVGWADGPGEYSINSGPTDGGDGHPWDDGTTEQTSPGDDETDPEQNLESDSPVDQPVFMVKKGFLSWTQRTLISLWHKVRDVALSQKSAEKAKVELKAKKSRRVL